MLLRQLFKLLVIIFPIALAACGEGDGGTKELASPPSTGVTVTRVIEVEHVEPIMATGTIAAKQSSNIGPLVEGVVEEIFVRVGDRVQKGDKLFRMRDVDYKRLVREAEASLDVAKAKYAQARRSFDRTKRLAEQGHISESGLDIARTELDVSRAGVNQAAAILETAQQQLRDTVVTAPFDGTVTARYIDEGVFMTNRSMGGGQSSVLELQEAHIVAGIMRAPESALPRLRLGQKAHLFIPGYDTPFESTVFIINDKIDSESRTVEFRLPVMNPDYSIKSGQFARAVVFPDPMKILVLPREAVRGSLASAYVIQIVDGKAHRKSVSVEQLDATRVRVSEGLEAGDIVVLTSESDLSEGADVEIVEEVENVDR